MTDALLHGLARAGATFALTALALPLVAWLEGLRGTSAAGPAVGPTGLRGIVASTMKLIEKRSPRAVGSDRPLHTVAPILAIIPAMSVLAALPVMPGDPLDASLPFVLGLPILSTAAVALAGYSGGSSLAHLAALRFVALRLSVAVVMGTAALAAARAATTLDLPGLVEAQTRPLIGSLPSWGVLVAPTSFLAALGALAVLGQNVQRGRTEPSLAVAWSGDASGPVLLGHRIFETLDLLAGACVVAVVFLGGWHLPGVTALPVLTALGKMALTLVLVVVARNALPQLTPAVAVRVCWVVLLPLAIVGLVLATPR